MLVVEKGLSAFVLMSDEPSAIERWGGEVVPALRDAVARGRDETGGEATPFAVDRVG